MDRWALIDAYFRDETVVSQQIESYNQFIHETIPDVIEENQVIDPEVGDFRIELKGVHLERPMVTEIDGSVRRIYPMEARIRDRNYMASI
jgi:DNA-directed RNA polymerase beta subunit